MRSALDIRVTWSGFEAVEPDRRFVMLALHENFVDVPLLAAFPLDVRSTAREELFKHQDIGTLLRASHHISIPEKRSASSVKPLVEQLRAAVAAGDSTVVFPQGSLLGIDIAFQPGAWRLARMLALAVLPVAISGTHRVWGHPLNDEVHLGREVFVSVLPPIEPSGWSADRARATERLLKQSAISTGVARRFEPHRDGWRDDYAFEIDPDLDQPKSEIDTHRLVLTSNPGHR
ncbi:MAG: lysophospholipid acyltransferase family protein [Acidimicrobiia bacterium]